MMHFASAEIESQHLQEVQVVIIKTALDECVSQLHQHVDNTLLCNSVQAKWQPKCTTGDYDEAQS